MTEVSRCEEEYLEFLEQFGHIDFTHVEFLPVLRTVRELKDIKQKKWMESNQMLRTNALLDSMGRMSLKADIGSLKKPSKEKWDDHKRRHLKYNKKSTTDLSEIQEEEEIVIGGEDNEGEKADVRPEGVKDITA